MNPGSIPPSIAEPAVVRTRGFPTFAGNRRRLVVVLAALLVSPHALALPDHLTVVTTNPNTNAQVTLELDRYNLRAPNWQCRIYSSPTSYTVLPADQVPEPTTYRGRTSDGGMVWSAVRPTNLTMYTRVNYGTIRFTGVGGGPHLSFNMALDSTGTPDPQAGYCYDAMDRSQSVSLWYKPDALPAAGRQYLYLKDASLYDETAGFIIGIDNGSFFARVQMYGPHGNPVEVKATTGPNILGVWYHVVGELDRENGQVHLFVNGQKFSSAAGVLPAGQFVVGPCPANMGAQTLWGYQGWRPAAAGSFDELRVYTKALTSLEVNALYEEPGLLPAGDPVPANNAVDINLGPLLSWSPGRPRYQFDVYFGTDAAAVAAAGTASTAIYQGRTGTAQFQVPVILDPTRAYFWRVDVVDGAPINTGQVWQFTTGLPSPAKDILSFTWNGCAGLIDQTARTIALTVPFGTNVTALAPTLALSRFATVSPATGVSRNFSSPLPYTVTAQDGSARVYTAAVYQAAQPGSVMTLPPDLSPGAQYRLVFVTSTETYGWKGANASAPQNIADYNTLATTTATASPALGALGTTWKAVVATSNPNADARTNTLTRTADPSVPVYNLGGLRVANGNDDLWDGSIANPINVTETGVGPAPQRGNEYTVWTGIYGASGANGGDWSLVTPSGGWILCGNATATDSTWATTLGTSDANARKNDLQPIYVMSGVLTAPAAPELATFNWGDYSGVIDQTARTVTLMVPYGTNLATLNPTCTLTPGATVSPASGAVPNPGFAYQNPLVYTVSAGVLHTDYTVTVTVTPISTACDLLALGWGGYTAAINGTNVTLAIPNGTDVTALNPTCTISPLATMLPASGTTRNFTTPQSYTVTAQNGITSKTYTVRVLLKPVVVPPDLSPGSKYRLVFVTGAKRDAIAQDIGTYNTFVANVAAGVPALNSLGIPWTCIGSAGNRSTGVYVNANQNTLTRASDPDAPIYRLDGLRVANGNTALWGDSLANPISINETGDFLSTKVWTGTRSTGVRNGDWFLGDTGGGWVYFGVSSGTNTGGGGSAWVDNLGEQKATQYSLYAISGILTVPDPPANTYANWAANHASGQDANLDHDGDGVPNGVEYFIGATGGSFTATPAVVNTGGTLTWTWPYDPAAAATYKFQLSDNLSGWTDVTPPDARITILTGPDRIRFTLPSGAVRKYCRLVVTPAP